jgi:hypothetical protein
LENRYYDDNIKPELWIINHEEDAGADIQRLKTDTYHNGINGREIHLRVMNHSVVQQIIFEISMSPGPKIIVFDSWRQMMSDDYNNKSSVITKGGIVASIHPNFTKLTKTIPSNVFIMGAFPYVSQPGEAQHAVLAWVKGASTVTIHPASRNEIFDKKDSEYPFNHYETLQREAARRMILEWKMEGLNFLESVVSELDMVNINSNQKDLSKLSKLEQRADEFLKVFKHELKNTSFDFAMIKKQLMVQFYDDQEKETHKIAIDYFRNKDTDLQFDGHAND